MSLSGKRNSDFDDAPRLIVSGLGLYGIRSNAYEGIGKYSWLPVCQYPVDWLVLEKESGSMVRLDKRGDIKNVIRRVFVSGKP